jgi:hypothetical protein
MELFSQLPLVATGPACHPRVAVRPIHREIVAEFAVEDDELQLGAGLQIELEVVDVRAAVRDRSADGIAEMNEGCGGNVVVRLCFDDATTLLRGSRDADKRKNKGNTSPVRDLATASPPGRTADNRLLS